MNQAQLFEPEARSVPANAFEARRSPEMEAKALNALKLYRDHNDMGWPAETEFDALWVLYMMDVEPEGPFCFCRLPAIPRYEVSEVIRALDGLASEGQIAKCVHYFGETAPGPGYRGYGYLYSLGGVA